MSLKVKIYSAMPSFVKEAMTRVYIALRSRREAAAAKQLGGNHDDSIRVVYITGFPRSGTTMLKYYFAGHDGLRQTAFSPVGFFDAWQRADDADGDILVDKSNHYIYALDTLFKGCGRGARVVVILRDPRDCLVSFAKYEENREVPRGDRYWNYWRDQHRELMRFAREDEHGDCLFLVRYEDLVRHPEEAKAAFLRWIGVDVDATDLDRRYRNDHPDEGWHDSVHDYREVGTHAFQKWKQAEDLPPWCQQRLQEWGEHAGVHELMASLGYVEDGVREPDIDAGRAKLFQPKEPSD